MPWEGAAGNGDRRQQQDSSKNTVLGARPAEPRSSQGNEGPPQELRTVPPAIPPRWACGLGTLPVSAQQDISLGEGQTDHCTYGRAKAWDESGKGRAKAWKPPGSHRTTVLTVHADARMGHSHSPGHLSPQRAVQLETH